jgi:hypothetical protein
MVISTPPTKPQSASSVRFCYSMNQFLPACLCSFIALLGVSESLRSQTRDASPEWFEHTPDNAWLLPYDTTLISRRAFAEFSYENREDDGDFWKIENSLRRGFAIREDLAFGVQAMIPVKWTDTATSDDSGLGDLELRSGLIGRFSPTLRWGAGLNAAFDTATDSSLGSNALVLRPTLGLRWDVIDRLNLGINFEYNFTPQEEQDDDVSALELKFPVVFKFNDHWSGIASYKPRWNLLNESDRHRLELGATRLFGADNQFALSFSLEVPLISESLDCKFVSGLAWNF